MCIVYRLIVPICENIIIICGHLVKFKPQNGISKEFLSKELLILTKGFFSVTHHMIPPRICVTNMNI